MRTAPIELANGYERVADEYMAVRNPSTGVAVVRHWANGLAPGATVLDLGCGNGVPITKTLLEAGLAVSGVDASPSMIAAFQARFPNCPAECARVEESRLFDQHFAGVVAWGLVFLLTPSAQELLITKVAGALAPGGRFLFTAPEQVAEWDDNLTGLPSVSLGAKAYRAIIEAAGLELIDQTTADGGNHYYFVNKPHCSG